MTFSPEQKEQILTMYCMDGRATNDISKALGVSRWSIETFLNKHNIIQRRRELRREDREQSIRQLFAENKSVADIAKELDLEESTVRKYLSDYGLRYQHEDLDAEKTVLITYLRAGLTIEQIADKMKCSRSGVRYKINRVGINAASERAIGKNRRNTKND